MKSNVDLAIDTSFLKKINYLDWNFIRQSNDIIYIIDNKFFLKAFNQAWVNFAKSNNGDSLLAKYPIGSNILDAISGPLNNYIKGAYEEALQADSPFEYEYKCPSANEDRIFRQSAYPLKKSIGLLVSNHLLVEKKQDEDSQEFNKRFLDERGLICECSCCRRVRDPDKLSWYWVPSLVEKPYFKTTHGICPQCISHFFNKKSIIRP